jgi:acetyl-CoA carboxylase carboxyltransferase component
MSGVVPQVAAMVGPGAAGTAYIPGLADFVPMVKDIGSLALGGPALVKAMTGEDISEQELGGSKVHCRRAASATLEVENDDACIAMMKRYLSYFPSSCEEEPPVLPCTDPIDRARRGAARPVAGQPAARLRHVQADSRMVVDHGEILDLKPKWAKSIITCLARIGGRSVGVVANSPCTWAACSTVDSADKAAHFIQICDAFNVPLLFLQDVPGFMIGSKVEHAGIIRHGAKMLHAMAAATVPKISSSCARPTAPATT